MTSNPHFRRFSQEANGSVAVIFALLSTVLFGVVALAVDMARAYSAQNKIAGALDAAALAGAKLLDDGGNNDEVREIAAAYFQAQMASLSVNNVTATDFNASIDRSKGTVTASIKVDMKTLFGSVLGHNSINMDRAAGVTIKTRNIELSMALDLSASMLDGTKLADLRLASTAIIDALFDESTAEDKIRISIVPWSTSVNAGAFANKASDGTSTDACVLEREGPEATTDAAPTSLNHSSAMPNPAHPWYTCTANSVTPLSGRSKRADLKTYVNNLSPTGGTAGHIGTAWGWYMLSPAWTSVWPHGAKPKPYNAAETVKSVLVMSDGEFNVAWTGGLINAAPTADTAIAMTDASYAHFQALCTEMKAKGIVVYTVGFGLVDVRSKDEMRACASGDAQFYQTADGAELNAAFKEIASKLKGIRVSK